MDDTTSVMSPGVFTWELRNGRRRETRTYEQGEVAIEGEARLIGIARKVGVVLGEAGYTFGMLGEFFDENREVDWDKALALAEHVALYAPDLIAETVTVFLSIYPTNEDGTRNASYDDEVAFLRGAINTARFVDMARVFMATNEYAKLIGPFSQTLSETMAAYGGPAGVTDAASPEPSGPQAIVSSDGSTVLLDDNDSPESTPTLGEASQSESDSEPKDFSTATSTETDELTQSDSEMSPEA